MPSIIHRGGNSATSSLLAGPLSHLDQEAGLYTFSVHEELTLEKGTRPDADYTVVVGGLMRSVLRQESTYKESLGHAVNKVSSQLNSQCTLTSTSHGGLSR